MKSKKKANGFSLIELLLSISLILVITSLSTGFYARFLTQNSLANTVDSIVQDLRKAQFYAMVSRKGSTSGWGVNYSANTLTLYQGASYLTRNASLDEKITVNPNISVAGLTDVNFARLTGIPSLAPTITVSGTGQTKVISVNTQGVVSR